MTGGMAGRPLAAARLTIGALSIAATSYWAGLTIPVLVGDASSGRTFGSVELADDQLGVGRLNGWIGCARSTSPADLDAFFADRQGPLLGWDNPHVTPLGDDRWLWLVHDTYLDYTGNVEDLDAVGHQIQNAAFIQTGPCFAILHSGTPTARRNFEDGAGQIDPAHFLWPLGAEVVGERLVVFWGETQPATTPPPSGHGITRHPVATWLASYDVATLERLTFGPAPNPGVDPVYGFAVASDESFSYLFGNTNQLNFWRDGGIENGPHSATRMFLARVPFGEFEQLPEYWTGDGWSADPHSAAPISERFWAENTMQPRFIGGEWISVVKRDGFFGVDIWIEVAQDPWGPWVAHQVLTHEPRPAAVEKNSYQPIILPWSSPTEGLVIATSENAVRWSAALADPSLYRPTVFEADWPDDVDGIINDAIERLASASIGAGR